MRKLASIQKIWKIEPIEGADRIELAHVLGWQCVVNKGRFQEGDEAIYFEIDSFLPMRPEYEFLRASSYKKSDILGEGYLLRSMNFRGELSQGLLLPIPDGITGQIGDDVSELLGVRKFEIEERATNQGTIIGKLPACVPHTDEPRIQSNPDLLQTFGDCEYYISTKMDGTSCSIAVDDNGFHVCGHNYEYSNGSFYDYAANLKEKLLGKNIVIQGEFCAPGIQKNRLKLKRPEWFVFTVIENGQRVGLKRMLEVCLDLDLTHVIIEEVSHDLQNMYPTVDSLLKRAQGLYPRGGQREGIVIRPTTPILLPNGEYLSFKVINNLYC